MAIVKKKTEVKAVAVLQSGLNDRGEDITKNKIISNISKDAEMEDIYDVVEIIADLQELPLVGIEAREVSSLINE